MNIEKVIDLLSNGESDERMSGFIKYYANKLWAEYNEYLMNEFVVIENKVKELPIVIPNASIRKPYNAIVSIPCEEMTDITLSGLTEEAQGLKIEKQEDGKSFRISGTPKESGTFDVKGSDSEYDVAVIAVPLDSISDDTMNAISVATLGDSTSLKVGEPAIAIGNALGYGQSVTTGVISALNRSASETDGETGEATEETSDARLIQTDAAINPGNSGGALVNANGEVIGINSSKLVGETVEGVGYAIPISDVSDLIQNLMNQETKTKVADEDQGVIGITGMSVPTEYSQQLNMPSGVYVSEVTSGGGAEKAGMTRGCVITAINGTTVDGMEALQEQLQYYAAGDTVTLTVQIPQTNGEYQDSTPMAMAPLISDRGAGRAMERPAVVTACRPNISNRVLTKI